MKKRKTENGKRKAAVGLALVLLFSTFGFAADQPARPASIQQWLSAQANLKTWSADLVQTRTLKTLTQPLVSTGKVWFASPNKFRWEIGSPPQTIAVRSGDEMFVIYPRLKRAEKYPLAGDNLGPWKDTLGLLEAGFPRSEADIDRQFRIASVSNSDGVHTLHLEPKSAAARKMMPHITVSFATNDFSLRATELQFADGSVMRNDFHNGKVNPPIDESLFKPEIGPGFKVIEPMKR
jgi:outer membrane lipoprotein-sorting protein